MLNILLISLKPARASSTSPSREGLPPPPPPRPQRRPLTLLLVAHPAGPSLSMVSSFILHKGFSFIPNTEPIGLSHRGRKRPQLPNFNRKVDRQRHLRRLRHQVGHSYHFHDDYIQGPLQRLLDRHLLVRVRPRRHDILCCSCFGSQARNDRLLLFCTQNSSNNLVLAGSANFFAPSVPSGQTQVDVSSKSGAQTIQLKYGPSS